MNRNLNTEIYKNYIYLILLAIIWGSSFILMKRGLEVYDYMQVAALRIFIAFLSLIPFLFKAFSNIRKRHLIPIAIMAFFGNGLPAFLFTKAQTHLDSSIVGVFNSLVPLFTLILGIFFFKIKPTKKNILGIIIAFIGAFVLSYSNIEDGVKLNKYVFLVILATVCYSISVNVIKKYLDDLNSFSITAIAFLFIGPLSFVYLINTNFVWITLNSPSSYLALFYIVLLAVIGTSLAVIIFNKLISRSSAIFASSVTYLIPIIAIFWGFLDGEKITYYHIIGVSIILCGVYLVNKKRSE